MKSYTDRIKIPHPDSINTGYTYAKQSTMLEVFGRPLANPTNDCKPITNLKLKRKIVTLDVGPFNATGHKLTLFALTRAFRKVKAEKPELYDLIGTAGCLCARLVRGSKDNFSNHSWGTAIDVTIGGQLDGVNDGKCLRGLLELYPYLHQEGFFWYAEIAREDSMHFEISNELILDWHRQGWAI